MFAPLLLAVIVPSSNACHLGDASTCTRMCERGDERACVVLGAMYTDGVGVDRDSKRGDALFAKACKKGEGDGCNLHGIHLRDALTDKGEGTWAAVLAMFKRGCDEGSAKACHNAADVVVDHAQDAASDASAAPSFERRGCELETEGSATSCLAYGQALAHGTNVDQDEVLAGKWLARACRLGAREACSMAEELGEKVVLTKDATDRLIQAKCDAGNPKACARVGFALLAKNPAAAKEPLDVACTADDARACSAVGAVLLRQGSLDGAARLSKACDLEDAKACRMLGDESLVGHFTARDDAKAVSLFKKACALGDDVACHHESGVAMAKTLKRSGDALAETVLTKDCKAGDADACFSLQGLKKPMVAAVVETHAIEAHNDDERACNAGDARACWAAANVALRSDVSRSRTLFDLGCRAGYPRACEKAGTMFSAGQGGAVDANLALDSYAFGCSLGNKASCTGASTVAAALGKDGAARVRPLLARACSAKVDGACDAAAHVE